MLAFSTWPAMYTSILIHQSINKQSGMVLAALLDPAPLRRALQLHGRPLHPYAVMHRESSPFWMSSDRVRLCQYRVKFTLRSATKPDSLCEIHTFDSLSDFWPRLERIRPSTRQTNKNEDCLQILSGPITRGHISSLATRMWLEKGRYPLQI